jgi:hypothetical protein
MMSQRSQSAQRSVKQTMLLTRLAQISYKPPQHRYRLRPSHQLHPHHQSCSGSWQQQRSPLGYFGFSEVLLRQRHPLWILPQLLKQRLSP